ncbi:TetR/AcrR family transcriptional regulator [Paradesulfitobacterium aromaticivorans]
MAAKEEKIMAREEKYQQILDAAIEAFAVSSYYQCQVSKIARLAGVADGTIYLYFKSKQDILIKLFQERMGDFINDIRTQIKDCQSTRERLKAIIKTHFSYMEQNRSLAIVTQVELRQSDPDIRSAITGPLKEYFKLIEEVVTLGIESGEVPVLDTRAARQLIFGALDEAVSDWVMARTPRSLSSSTDAMLFLFEGALRLK